MKSIILINSINIGLLIALIALYVILGFPVWFLAIFGVWILFIVISNIYLLKASDIKSKLIQVDSREEFKGYVKAICNAIDSIEFFRKEFTRYPPDSNVRQTFDTLDKKAYQNAERAYRWIKTYNYIVMPSQEYIIRIAENSYQITENLSRMNDLLIKAADSSSNVDISEADDFIATLRNSLEDWKYE